MEFENNKMKMIRGKLRNDEQRCMTRRTYYKEKVMRIKNKMMRKVDMKETIKKMATRMPSAKGR